MANIKKIGDTIQTTCPVSGKSKSFVVIGRNWSFDTFVSYMVSNVPSGRCVTTVNSNGVSQFRLA